MSERSEGQIKGRIEQTGVRVQEIYTIELDPAEHEAYYADPATYMKRFLEEKGFVVNGVHFDIGSGAGGSAEARPGGTWVHELWPYKSDWHCCY